MKPTNKLRAISEQALKNLTTRHTRLVPTERSLPDPQMLKDFLQLDLPHGDPRTRRLDHAADIWDLRAIAKRRTPKGPFDYVDGGAKREISMARSREVFDNLAFRPGYSATSKTSASSPPSAAQNPPCHQPSHLPYSPA